MKGFSLIETLVVISMLALIASIGFPASIEGFERAASAHDQSLLRTALMRARQESLAGMCEGTLCTQASSHGVYIDAANITIFQGDSYIDRYIAADMEFPIEGITQIEGSPEVVFSTPSGTTLSNASIILHNRFTRTIYAEVNQEGRVSVR